MSINKDQIQDLNRSGESQHQQQFEFLQEQLEIQGINTESVISKLQALQVAIPSWALGAGGTRFGRFSYGGEPATLEEKINDVGIIHSLTRSAGAISLHIPWDTPEDPEVIRKLAAVHGLTFDAMNSNTFQDQQSQNHSYKYGSLCHTNDLCRQQAIEHNKQVIDIGVSLGSKSLTVWLADGSCFPGQLNFRKALERTMNSLKEIYHYMPADWKLFIEYKPYEPNFYSTVIQDWGTSHLLANECGENAFCLVDLGHHLPNTNIEQIVATLLWKGKLGGFHFNDSKYGDDDLTVGSIKPYQLFLIFNELVNRPDHNPSPAWMIDASHNLKDPLEDLLQSLEAIRLAYAQALLVDQQALEQARISNDVTLAQEILHRSYRADIRPLLSEARLRSGGALYPLDAYRKAAVREKLIERRGLNTVATGL
ncbi:MAG: L-rhamnose catabolism isomerase [Cyclobacteriaceae bacterium]|nr:MAG: L-rhamnose catabolism isomerase [Cyclobacteriaceae bacterium]